MSASEKQLIHDLAKEYTFKTFDFKNKSPEDLLFAYQENFSKIETIIDEENANIANEIAQSWLASN